MNPKQQLIQGEFKSRMKLASAGKLRKLPLYSSASIFPSGNHGSEEAYFHFSGRILC